jgi:SAM-dependent methyltransferase
MMSTSFEAAITSTGYTDSPYEYYARVFDLPQKAGQLILDLGSGVQNSFGNDPQNHVHTVVSLNPRLAFSSPREELLETEPGNNTMAVAGLAQTLPFKTGTFDKIYSAYAVPHHVPAAERPKAYSEVLRILKLGGTAQFFPLTSDVSTELTPDVVTGSAIHIDWVDDALVYRLPEIIRPLVLDALGSTQMKRLTMRKVSKV